MADDDTCKYASDKADGVGCQGDVADGLCDAHLAHVERIHDAQEALLEELARVWNAFPEYDLTMLLAILATNVAKKNYFTELKDDELLDILRKA